VNINILIYTPNPGFKYLLIKIDRRNIVSKVKKISRRNNEINVKLSVNIPDINIVLFGLNLFNKKPNAIKMTNLKISAFCMIFLVNDRSENLLSLVIEIIS